MYMEIGVWERGMGCETVRGLTGVWGKKILSVNNELIKKNTFQTGSHQVAKAGTEFENPIYLSGSPKQLGFWACVTR